MRDLLITLLLLLVLANFSCGKKIDDQIKVPPGILDKTDFANVLVKFALSESAAVTNVKALPFQKTDSVYAFNPLAESGIRRSQFDSSMSYYSAHPELYKKVYDTVLVILSEIKAVRNVIVPDSIAK